MTSKLILASGSPRRKELLEVAGFEFAIEVSAAEEIHTADIPLEKLCETNAKMKALDVAKHQPDSVVIGSDTLVYIDNKPLGKPRSESEAVETLRLLSGRSHQVCTGVCITSSEKTIVFHEVTHVRFKTISDEEIKDYMSKVNVMDKAGSYAVQEHGDLIVKSVDGDHSNVVGLPVELTIQKLSEFGVYPANQMRRIPKGHRYPLLFNPHARSKRGRRALLFLMANAKDFVLYATRDVEDAKKLAAEFAAKGEPVVLAAGGDGTLNAVMQGLIGSDTALGVLPAGTMNVFAREMGIPVPNMQSSNLEKALEVIKGGYLTNVDLFRANGQAFVQMAGVGFDAQVIEDTSLESKKVLGPLAYLMSAVKLLGEDPPKMKILLNDGTEAEGVAVLAGNGELYGGQVRLFPKANNTDGLLDILIFKEPGYKFVLDSLKGMVGLLDLVESSVEYLQAESFVVISDREVPIEIDGEYLGRAKRVEFTATSKKLSVLTPTAPAGGFIQVWKHWVQNLPRMLAGDRS